jgi:hypothetical protein
MTSTFYYWTELPAPFHTNVRVLLNRVLPQRWFGRAVNGNNNFSLGHPVRRNLHHAISFFGDSRVYVPPLPTRIQELRDRITHALQAITADRLHRVWDESDYRVAVSRVTQGAHIEEL